jgi:heat shock protein HslJ
VRRGALGLALLLGLLWLAACGSQPEPEGLDGTSWVLRALHGQDPAPGTTLTLVFEGDAFYGYAGCNAYGQLAAGEGGMGGGYATAGKSLSFPEVAVGEVDCPAPSGVMEQEAAYLEALRSADAFRLAGDQLEILDAEGYVALIFEIQ